jgi:signal transduction histidine kinase
MNSSESSTLAAVWNADQAERLLRQLVRTADERRLNVAHELTDEIRRLLIAARGLRG